MRQVVISKNPLIKEVSGSKIEFFFNPKGRPDWTEEGTAALTLSGGKANRVVIPFSVKVISGGTIDLDFKISQKLAEAGVSLLGAYWDGEQVTGYLMPMDGTDVEVSKTLPVMVGTLVQVSSFRQVSDKILGGSGKFENGVLVLDKVKEKKRNK